jgi:hypothetical protein
MKLNTDNQFLHINKEQMRLTFVVSKEEYVKMESFHEVILNMHVMKHFELIETFLALQVTHLHQMV